MEPIALLGLILLLAVLLTGAKCRQMINPPPPKEKNMNIEKHLKKLGHQCRDKVTGLEGVITHVGFDLYGCVQAIVHPGVDKEGKLKDTIWFDIERLEITHTTPVMKQPDFLGNNPQALGLQGPGEKPLMNKG